jgi:hypothetical protein
MHDETLPSCLSLLMPSGPEAVTCAYMHHTVSHASLTSRTARTQASSVEANLLGRLGSGLLTVSRAVVQVSPI